MSSWSLFYYDEVRFDIRDAKEWYRKTQTGLEKRFASSVKETILRLQETPLIYQPRYKHVRVAYTPIFPYAVHFM
ncbi:hypothetical protein DDR33_17510 [Pararcticibacter amylolyticus]|uniref:Type II toxin-antitoxin system RelE/ParE family toxin n=1 Tax=Pararcticibacter amylolyticus TaxID=2173175 RepID=A0A2U2PD52_9SPHI|nr:hypothetical protein DDR33_17510 [Pararcticibacter amylolyticus]